MSNLIQQFKLKSSGTLPDLKYIMYSAHDDNLVPFMVAYNLTSTDCVWKKYQSSVQNRENVKSQFQDSTREPDDVCESAPGFASSFLWELSYNLNDQKYYVRSLFNGRAVDFCTTTTFEGEHYCEFGEFQKIAESTLLLKNLIYNQTCGSIKYQNDEDLTSLRILLSLMFIALFFMLIIAVYLTSSQLKIKNEIDEQKKRLIQVGLVQKEEEAPRNTLSRMTIRTLRSHLSTLETEEDKKAD